MGNETSAEQGAPGEASLRTQSPSPGNYSTPNGSPTRTERAPDRGIPDLSISTSMDEFTTPTATPSASVRPSPSVSARTSPLQSRISSSESLQSFQSSARLNTTITTKAAENDTLDAKPKSALHENIMIASNEAEDHAWMDPVLAAAAAGAASKKSRDAVQAHQAQPSSLFGIRVDDDWRESLEKLASTTKSTAKSFAHVAAPVLSEAADTVKRSALGEQNQFSSRESDNRDWGTTTTTGDTTKYGDSNGRNDQESKSGDVPTLHLSESFQRLTSSTKSAASAVAAAATPVQMEATKAVINSAVDKNGDGVDDSVSSRQMSESDTSVLVDEKLRGSFKRFASTTQSAATAFVQVAKPVLSEASGVLMDSLPVLVEATDLVRKSVIEVDEESNQVRVGNKSSTDNGRGQMNGCATDDDPPKLSNADQSKPIDAETAAVKDDWRESLERFATTAKSATTSLSHLASPILEETVDALKTTLPDTESDNEMGKYGGVGYRPIVRDEGNESKDEWKDSLQRLASTTKSAATSLVAVAPPLIPEGAETAIESMKEAVESYQVPKVGNNEGIESGQETNTSQGDEMVLASPGWHDEKTPLRSHRGPLADGDATGSPGSLATPGSFDETKSTISRDTKSPPKKTRQRDRDECTSVASLSSRRRNHDGRNKNSISSPGRLVEMVSKRLAPDNSGFPPTHGGGKALGGQRTSGSASRTGSITPIHHIFDNQSIFQDERQPETSAGLSPPGSPEQSGSITTSALNTPPRVQPPQEVTLWDMFPESESQIVGEGSFVIEPRARVVLESSVAHFEDDLRPGSTYSSEEESLPMSTGFIGKQANAYDSNDTASDPGLIQLKMNRKLRRGSHLRLRGSRNPLHPSTLSLSSSAVCVDSLNLDARSTFEELSLEAQQVAEAPSFQSPDALGESTVQISELPNGMTVTDRTLDEALMAFSLLPDVDFLSKISTQSIPKPLQTLASIRWRQLTANWEHDEMTKAITMRPCSIHSFSELYEQEEGMHDWSDSWTTTAYHTKRNLQFSVQEEFRKTQKATPLMNNLSGFHPFLVDGQFQYLTPYLIRIGPTRDCHGVISTSSKFADSRNGPALKHSMGIRKDIVMKDLLTCAISKSASYLTLLKDIATFATNNSDPTNPASAVRFSVDVKTAGAIKEKAKRKYNGDILQVKDILRGQITFPNESSLVCAMLSLYDLCDPGKSDEEAIKIVRVKNLFQKMPAKSCFNDCLPTGYRHVLITIKFHDGFLAEMQLQLAQMFDILGHDGYELHREITKMDTGRSKALNPHFDRYAYDGSLKTILHRVFNAPGRAKNTAGDEIGEPISTSSPSALAIEGISGVSTTTVTQARNKDKPSNDGSTEEPKVVDDDSRPGPPPFLAGGGIAAAAAAAAQARNKDNPLSDGSNEESKVDDGDSRPGPPPFLAGGGIAAAAAAAAQARNKGNPLSDGSNEESKVGDDGDSRPGPPPFLAGGGIAAAAAAAAQARNKGNPLSDGSNEESKVGDDGDSRPGPPPFLAGGGIAAAAAAAAQARNKDNSLSDGSNEESKVGDDGDSRPGPPPFLAGGGIAAAAAAAAQARNKGNPLSDGSNEESKVDDGDSRNGPPPFLAGGGIAAAAAAAAQARNKDNPLSDGSNEESKVDDGDSRPGPPPFLAGGGIAAAAAAAAQARNKDNPLSDGSNEESKVDDGDSRPGPPPFLAGGGIAAAAAAAARARNKDKPLSDGSNEEIKVDEDANFRELFRPYVSALDGALDDFHGSSSKEEPMPHSDTYTQNENALIAPSARTSGAVAETNDSGGFDFSDREIIQALVLEALKDASIHSRRISTLYCAASLCLFLASGPDLAVSDSKNALSRKASPSSQTEAESITDPPSADQHIPTSQSPENADDVDNRSSNEHDDVHVELIDAKFPDVTISKDTEPSNEDSIEQEEKKEAQEDPGSPSLFRRMFGSKKSISQKKKKPNAQSGIADTKNVPNESVNDIVNKTSKADPNDAAEGSSSKQVEQKSDGRTNGEPAVSPPIDEINDTEKAPETNDEPKSIEKHEGAEDFQSFDSIVLVDLSERALLRGLTIANQASSHGMIGWLEYGSSNFLDRTARRPLDILGKLAYHHAMRKDWQVAEDLMRTLVLRCEQHLPLYHPVTLSAMLDLASTCSSSSEHVLARHLLDQVSNRLAFYLNEQESAYFDYHESARLRGNGVDVAFQPLTGAEHVSMLRSFTTLLEELLDRDYAQLFGGENEVLLVNHCLVGDSFSVLANCLQLSETYRERKKASSPSCDSITYWSTAFHHYRLAFEGWTRKGYDLAHPNVSGVACSMARCLRELGETEKASLILNSVVGATSVKDEIPIVMEKDENENHSLQETIFLPREASSAIRSRSCAQEATALRLWCMAAYAVESFPDERGRIRALSLLHASSETLQECLKEAESISDKSTSARTIELLECVEDEARALFAPLNAMREETRPRNELIIERGANRSADAETGAIREQYPTRNKVHQTSTKANFFPSAFA